MNQLERGSNVSLEARIEDRAQAELESNSISAAVRLAGVAKSMEFDPAIEQRFLAKQAARLL